MTCLEADQTQDKDDGTQATKDFLEAEGKSIICFSCKHGITKVDGCAHVTCICKSEVRNVHVVPQKLFNCVYFLFESFINFRCNKICVRCGLEWTTTHVQESNCSFFDHEITGDVVKCPQCNEHFAKDGIEVAECFRCHVFFCTICDEVVKNPANHLKVCDGKKRQKK